MFSIVLTNQIHLPVKHFTCLQRYMPVLGAKLQVRTIVISNIDCRVNLLSFHPNCFCVTFCISMFRNPYVWHLYCRNDLFFTLPTLENYFVRFAFEILETKSGIFIKYKCSRESNIVCCHDHSYDYQTVKNTCILTYIHTTVYTNHLRVSKRRLRQMENSE